MIQPSVSKLLVLAELAPRKATGETGRSDEAARRRQFELLVPNSMPISGEEFSENLTNSN